MNLRQLDKYQLSRRLFTLRKLIKIYASMGLNRTPVFMAAIRSVKYHLTEQYRRYPYLKG
jgi:hypothetical protein